MRQHQIERSKICTKTNLKNLVAHYSGSTDTFFDMLFRIDTVNQRKSLGQNAKTKSYNDKCEWRYYGEPEGGAGPIPRNQEDNVSLRFAKALKYYKSITGYFAMSGGFGFFYVPVVWRLQANGAV